MNAKVGKSAANAATGRSQHLSTVAITGIAWVVGGAHSDMLEKDDTGKLLILLFFTLLIK